MGEVEEPLSVPWSSVVAGPPLGLEMFQSAKTIGIDPLTWMVAPERRAVTGKVTDLVVPCMVSLPVAFLVVSTPSAGSDPRSIGWVKVNVAVG